MSRPIVHPVARHRARAGAFLRNREFWRDAATLAQLAGGGILIAVGLWFYTLGWKLVS